MACLIGAFAPVCTLHIVCSLHNMRMDRDPDLVNIEYELTLLSRYHALAQRPNFIWTGRRIYCSVDWNCNIP